ncbi:MAG: hypothetical protein U0525_04020 [Patescibacteria group bacterium]
MEPTAENIGYSKVSLVDVRDAIKIKSVVALVKLLFMINDKIMKGQRGSHFRDTETLTSEINDWFGNLEIDPTAEVNLYMAGGGKRINIYLDDDGNPKISAVPNDVTIASELNVEWNDAVSESL